jgi:integrase/recombinase XerD
VTELRRRMIEDMKLHGLSPTTQRVYVDAVKVLAEHYHRSPDRLSEDEIRQFFTYLTETRRLAPCTIQVYVFAIKFLYQRTLRRQWPVLGLLRVKRPKKLPVVLSPDEVWHLLDLVRRPAARMSLILMYSCGLRVSEAIHLRVSDIDGRRMVVCVRGGKGAQDRNVPLPARTLELLRAYWLKHRSASWLFPSRDPAKPITTAAVRRCLKAALSESGIKKRVSCHTLRHSYATHLLEKGVNLRSIQALLGHRSCRMTFIYMHLTEATMQVVHGAVNGLMAKL